MKKTIVFATGNPHKLQELKGIAGDCGIDFVLPPEGFDPVEDGKTFEENSLIKAREAARVSGLPALADDSGLCVEALNGEPGIYSARYAETPQKRIDKLLKELNEILRLKRHSERSEESHALKPQNDEIERRAKFVCAMTLVSADGEIIFQTIGECHGYIAKTQSGTNGFGYDPIFVPLTSPQPSPYKGKGAIVNEATPSCTNAGESSNKYNETSPLLQRYLVGEGTIVNEAIPSCTNAGEVRTMAELSEDEKNKISHRGNALRKVLEFINNNK